VSTELDFQFQMQHAVIGGRETGSRQTSSSKNSCTDWSKYVALDPPLRRLISWCCYTDNTVVTSVFGKERLKQN